MKSVAEGVITTLTLASSFIKNLISIADLYAAILPVTPTKMFLPRSINYPNKIPGSPLFQDTCMLILHLEIPRSQQ